MLINTLAGLTMSTSFFSLFLDDVLNWEVHHVLSSHSYSPTDHNTVLAREPFTAKETIKKCYRNEEGIRGRQNIVYSDS